MASLRAPGLGPIVGATTHQSCRVWIRAGDPADAGARLDANRRTVGVIGIVDKTKNKISKAWYFRLQREFDRTGVFCLGVDVPLGEHKLDVEAHRRAQPGKRIGKATVPQPLQPDTEYTIRIATMTLDDPLPDAENLADWQLRDRLPDVEAVQDELMTLPPEECEATFRTWPGDAKPVNPLSFMLGSCRYPGLLWKVKEADRIFKPMQQHLVATSKAIAARFTLMVGDQIYADALNKGIPILRADTYEEFQERYTTAFGAPNLRRLLRMAPTYMILDDHEIEDNWTQDRLREDGNHLLFNVALTAYMNYQWSHSPRTWGRFLYYTFECGGYPFFILDTRTQRFKDDHEGLRDNHMLGRPSIDPNHPGQLQRLLDWLSEQQNSKGNGPKFIVTSSVFVPNSMDERLDPLEPPKIDGAHPQPPLPKSIEDAVYEANQKRRNASDSWPAFPNTRQAILKHIVQNKIQNVVFLAGDIHCSNVAEIEFDGEEGKGLKAFSVTSSAFYWPFPFADGDPNGFVHNSRLPGQSDPFPILGTSTTMHYRSYGYTQEDNFSRVDIDPGKCTMTVTVFDVRGVPVRSANAAGKNVQSNALQLAKW